MKLPWISRREIVNALLRNGFSIKNQSGSHVVMLGFVKGMRRMAVVPVHSNQDLAPGTLLSIIKRSGFTKEEFLRLIE